MVEHSKMGIERMSSIEKEPQTLMFDQIQLAREAALYVMKTKTIEEAISIFTESQPVLVKGNKEAYIDDDIWKLGRLVTERDELTEPKDIVSAPF